MSILIKDINMPHSCGECSNSGDFPWLCASQHRNYDDYVNIPPSDCPLIEVSTPHGDLIDKNTLFAKIEQMEIIGTIDNENDFVVSSAKVLELIDDAPIIIESEGDA